MPFFLENTLKKLLNIFSNFVFYLKDCQGQSLTDPPDHPCSTYTSTSFSFGIYRVRQITKSANRQKKLLNNFSNFFFYFKVQSFRLIMENNFIEMAASAGHSWLATAPVSIFHSPPLS